jgi:putative isomerase
MGEYEALMRRLAHGWNTWNTRSVLSHVLLPEACALNLCLKEYTGPAYLKEAQIGRPGQRDEVVHPGPRSYDGTYSELTLRWRGLDLLIQSATEGDDLVLLVTPRTQHRKAALLVVEAGILWNRVGSVALEGEALVACTAGRPVRVYATTRSVQEPYVAAQTPYLSLPLDRAIGISTGARRGLDEVTALVARRRAELGARSAPFGALADVYAAIQTCLAWDTVYEPEHDRVVSPVSRIWNVDWGGFVLFDWDTYFAAYMAALDNKDLAYANAIEITREKTERGFIPNFASAGGIKSRDRSQPPVGSLVVREIYRRFGERWLLEEVFPDLLEWNRWWPAHRSHDGLLCWGSDPYEPVADAYFETHSLADWQGAAYESGLDNSPMYEGVPFNPGTHLMELADVGLMSMYVMDCTALADIAAILGRQTEAGELRGRAKDFRAALKTLWHEPTGMFLNRRTDTGEWSRRLSPTLFYPLLARAATRRQAGRMLAEHLYNPVEFWGAWVLPSIARNDPAYPEQDYWRGRIWGPMNLLVYLGLRHYGLAQARADLAEKSKRLLLKEWRERGHVHENYNGDTGEGCDQPNSDAFYHWGGLLGLPALMEAGHLAGPEQPLV